MTKQDEIVKTWPVQIADDNYPGGLWVKLAVTRSGRVIVLDQHPQPRKLSYFVDYTAIYEDLPDTKEKE